MVTGPPDIGALGGHGSHIIDQDSQGIFPISLPKFIERRTGLLAVRSTRVKKSFENNQPLLRRSAGCCKHQPKKYRYPPIDIHRFIHPILPLNPEHPMHPVKNNRTHSIALALLRAQMNCPCAMVKAFPPT
jgi:hypothetical protein